MPRLLFEKSGNAVWISHLDLMRLFQRAFKRAGLPLTHTHGYNPRPSVSIALPLSVGVESCCEILDFDLNSEMPEYSEILERLNAALVDGIKVLDVYNNGMKLRDLSLMKSIITMQYNGVVPESAETEIHSLFNSSSLIVEKKTKNGIQDQDIIPMIHSLEIDRVGKHALEITLIHCCQNPTLNPMQIPAAINKYLPECSADSVRYCRKEIFDQKLSVFR